MWILKSLKRKIKLKQLGLNCRDWKRGEFSDHVGKQILIQRKKILKYLSLSEFKHIWSISVCMFKNSFHFCPLWTSHQKKSPVQKNHKMVRGGGQEGDHSSQTTERWEEEGRTQNRNRSTMTAADIHGHTEANTCIANDPTTQTHC